MAQQNGRKGEQQQRPTGRLTGLREVWSARVGETRDQRDRQRVLDFLRMHAAVMGRSSVTAREVAVGLGMETAQVVALLKVLIAEDVVAFVPGGWVLEVAATAAAATADMPVAAPVAASELGDPEPGDPHGQPRH